MITIEKHKDELFHGKNNDLVDWDEYRRIRIFGITIWKYKYTKCSNEDEDKYSSCGVGFKS